MRILFADDHRLLRDGLSSFLVKLAPKSLVLGAESLEEALVVAEDADGVDLALLGQGMPGLNGSTGISLFRRRFPAAKVVLLTTVSDPIVILAAISAGADGVIFKTISGEGMLAALRLVLSGEIYLPSDVLIAMANLAVRSMIPSKETVLTVMTSVKFSPAETSVVPLLLDGLSNKQIAERLAIEEPAVKARLRGIYKKLGASNRAQAVWALLANGDARSQ